MKTFNAAVIAVAGLMLAACGGGAKLGGGKQGAAQALYQASSAVSSAQSKQSPLTAGAGVNATVDVQGQNGGTAKVSYSLGANPGSGEVSMTVAYDHFNHDGKNTYDGTLTVTLKTETSGTGATFATTMKGKITISGEVSDFLEADVTQTVKATALPTGGEVSVVLNGSIQTSTEKFTYANETVKITADGKLPVAATP